MQTFIQMYSNVVLNVDHHNFETILDDIKLENDITNDANFTESLLEEVIVKYRIFEGIVVVCNNKNCKNAA